MAGVVMTRNNMNATAQVTWWDHDDAHDGTKVGSFSVTILETSKVITFATAMPDANYQVYLQPLGVVSASFYPSNLTPDGFTVNLSAGVNASFAYLAVKS